MRSGAMFFSSGAHRRMASSVPGSLERLEAAGYEAWCVGGAVRDALLGLEPGDWDVATSAPPEAFFFGLFFEKNRHSINRIIVAPQGLL